MPVDDYGDWAAEVSGVAAETPPSLEKLAYLGLGLTGEAGESVEHIKKLLRDGRLNEDALADELGDVAYYWACLCRAIGRTPSEVLAESRRKIDAKIAAKAAARGGPPKGSDG